jgi:hypothetical protein
MIKNHRRSNEIRTNGYLQSNVLVKISEAIQIVSTGEKNIFVIIQEKRSYAMLTKILKRENKDKPNKIFFLSGENRNYNSNCTRIEW